MPNKTNITNITNVTKTPSRPPLPLRHFSVQNPMQLRGGHDGTLRLDLNHLTVIKARKPFTAGRRTSENKPDGGVNGG